ncbi:MAG: hypothetical protein IJ460_05795 [Clostridia bacterium]|nr:hypothetical protein [Oscillospiraceae bacterium]MBQ8526208.1 hypothetical protein [Clostridia bacterium]
MRNRFTEIRDIPETPDDIKDTEISEKEIEIGDIHQHTNEKYERIKEQFTPKSEGKALEEDYLSDEDVAALETRKSDDLGGWDDSEYADYSDEELEELWDNDPGYLNKNVLYFYGEKKSADGKEYFAAPENSSVVSKDENFEDVYADYSELYKQTGLHVVSWNKDYVEGTKENVELKPGMVIERWIDPEREGGRYFTEEGSDFDELHMNVSEDKREKVQYEVLMPLQTEKSIIAEQPFDEKQPEDYKPTVQFKTSMSCDDLIELGYIRKIDDKEK